MPTAKTKINEKCAMSLDLPPLVGPGVFLLLYRVSFRAAEKLFFSSVSCPFSKVGYSELYSKSSAYPSFHGTVMADAAESL